MVREHFEIYTGLSNLKDPALNKDKIELTFFFQKEFDEMRCRKTVKSVFRNNGPKAILSLPRRKIISENLLENPKLELLRRIYGEKRRDDIILTYRRQLGKK